METRLPILTFPRSYVIRFLFVFSTLFPLHLASAAQTRAEIRSIQFVGGSGTDIVISSNRQFQFYIFGLRNPERLVIDCRRVVLSNSVSASLGHANPIVNRFSIQPVSPDEFRFVFELKQRAKYSAWISGNDIRVRITPSGAARALQKEGEIEMSVSTGDKNEPVKDSEKKKPKVKMGGYVVDQYQKNVVTSNSDEPSMGSAYGMSLRYRKQNKSNNATLKVEYVGFGYEYNEPFVTDYMYNDFKLGYQWDLGSHWRVRTVGQIGLYDYGDLYGFRPEVSYRIDENSALSFYGGNRSKVNYYYSQRTDQERFLGMKYKTRVGNQTFTLGYQRNFNDAEKSRYDYVRTRYSIGYDARWSKRARTTFKMDYSPRLYPSRYISLSPDPYVEFGDLREDQGLKFSLACRIALTKRFELVPRYTYEMKNSNDPSVEDYSAFVSSINLRTRW